MTSKKNDEKNDEKEATHPTASNYNAPVEHPEDELVEDAKIARNGGTLSQDDINDMPAEDKGQFHPGMKS